MWLCTLVVIIVKSMKIKIIINSFFIILTQGSVSCQTILIHNLFLRLQIATKY